MEVRSCARSCVEVTSPSALCLRADSERSWLEAFDATEKEPWSLRAKASYLLLYVAGMCCAELEASRQDIPAQVEAAREKGCRLHWAMEVARRGREQREQQQREQQHRETHAGDACDSLSKASKTAELLNEYVCPITAEIMTDPVCTLEGFTYERAAITEWLRTNDTSPATGKPKSCARAVWVWGRMLSAYFYVFNYPRCSHTAHARLSPLDAARASFKSDEAVVCVRLFQSASGPRR